MTVRRCFASLACALAFTVTSPALAQSPDPSRAEAAERFDRAIRLVNSGDLSGGLAEFQRAYTLSPSPIVVYNLGLVYAQLNRPVESARALEKALVHAEMLKPEDVDRARQVLREQTDKIGHVELSASVKEGDLEIDNVEVAKLPLTGPIDVASGAHVVGVISPGYAPARREVLVAGRETVQVRLELVAIEGLLAHIGVACSVPGADVFVDGERVGKTPLEATVTVAPGAHQVEIRRAGYATVTRAITLQDGARADLSLSPVVDPHSLDREGGYVALKTSESQAVLSVDGAEVGLLAGPVQLPAGPHRLRLERGGFLPAERDLNVPLAKTTALSVVFEPTPDTRAKYVAGAESRRTWSWLTIGAGVVVAAGGAILSLEEQHELPSAQRNLDAVNADRVRKAGGSCDFATDLTAEQEAVCNSRLSDASTRVDNLRAGRAAGWIATGVGGAAIVAGAVLLLTGDNPHKYDEKPNGEVLSAVRLAPTLGPRGVSLTAVATF